MPVRFTHFASLVASGSRRRPAVLAALAFCAGVATHAALPHRPAIGFAVAAAGALGAAAAVRRAALSTTLLFVALWAAGIAVAQLAHYRFPGPSIADYTTEDPRLARVEVYLDESPQWIASPADDPRPMPPRQTCVARVTAVETTRGWTPCGGRLLLYCADPAPTLAAGQTVRATGMLLRPRVAMNPGEFDDAAFERDRGVLALLRVPHAICLEAVADAGPPPRAWMREKTRHLLAMGFSPERGFHLAFLRALLLGDPDPQLADVQDAFVRSGTLHQLSISGLHLAVLGGAVLVIARLLRVPPGYGLLASTLAMCVYAAVALPSGPGVRSLALGLAAAAGVGSRRSVDGLQLLAVSTLGVLLYDPAELHRGGFQVSLVAVLGLILFAGKAERWLHRKLWPDAGAPRSTIVPLNAPRPSLLRRGRGAAGRVVFRAAVAGFVAWAVSIPLVAYQFEQVNLWSVPAGLLLFPLTLVSLLGAAAKVLLSLAWPTASPLWAWAAALPVGAMHATVVGLSRLPRAGMPTAPPTLPLLLCCYGSLALLLVPVARRWLRRSRLVMPLGAYAVLIVLPAGAAAPAAGMSATLLAVGAGQCGVVALGDGHAVLIDAGSDTVPDVYRRVLGPYLRHTGVRTLDAIFLSHGDYDHISAALEASAAYRQGDGPRIYISPHFRRHAIGNLPDEELLDELDKSGRQPIEVAAGDRVPLGPLAAIDVLWPPRRCDMSSNNCGLVLRLTSAGRTVLFPADVQDPPERQLLRRPEQLKCDVLIAPHHGSAEAATPAFLQACRPALVIGSDDSTPSHKQKVFDAIETAAPLVHTHAAGAVTLTITPGGSLTAQTFDRGPITLGSPNVATRVDGPQQPTAQRHK